MIHKARTKALSWLLTLAMLLSLVPAFSLTAWAGDVTPYDVWVGGVQVTSANASDVFGDGKVSYTPAIVDGWPANLTLNGYSYEGEGHAGNTFSGAIYAEQDLEIILDYGSSNIVTSAGNDAATSCAIYVAGNLTIRDYGSGSLTASGQMGIVAGRNLTIVCDTSQIPSGSITVTGNSGSGIRSVNGNIEIQDGNLTVNGGTYGVSTDNHTDNGVGDLTIIGGTLTVNGDYGIRVNNMVFDKDRLTRRTVVTASGKSQAIYADTVTGADLMYVKAGTDKDHSSPVDNTDTWTHTEKWVKAKVFPKLYVGGTQVTRSVRSGNGWSFDLDTDTLTLNGYSYENVGYLDQDLNVSGGIYARQSLNIELNGNNRVINTRDDSYPAYAIHVSGKLSISGTGTLMAKGVNGIFATSEIAIESGTVDVTSTGTSFFDVCIYSYAVTINGGTVTASGNQAIDGMVKNAIAGTGWTNTEGTEGEASIAISTDGQRLDSYKKIQFLGHTHTFTSYTLNDAKNTITAECSNADGKCKLSLVDNKHTATLTIAAPTESGTGGAATITDAAGIRGTAKVMYESRTSEGWSTASEAVPSTAGVYRASITLGTATASVTYGVNAITKGNVTGENCNFTVPRVATVGAKVTPTLTIAPGYEVTKITVKDASNNDVSNNDSVKADKEGFTMPDYSVTVYIEFGKIDYTITKNSMTHGSVTVKKGANEVTTAQIGDPITLTASPEPNYELTSLTVVKDGSNADVNISGTGDTRTFDMPASNVTVSAVFEGARFGITILDAITGGTVTAKQNNVSVTQARAGSEVTLTATPAAGYQLGSFTVTKQGGETVTVTDNKFTMPAEAVTVSATFVGRAVSVSLTEAGKDGTTCKAALLTETFAPVGDDFKRKAGEKFVLRVSTDDEYDYSITFDPTSTVSTYLKEFSTEEYRSYAAYAKEHNISVPLSTDLFWVTMPGVAGDTLNITVTFAKVKSFTILYQPTSSTDTVWCKFTKTTDGTERPFAVDMMPDAIMGDQSVWTVKVTAAFAPAQVAFVTSKDDLATAALTNITARQEVPTEDSHWTSVTGGKAVVIGGNAKTVMALFVTNAGVLADYESLTATYNKGEGSGITFKVAVCKTNDSGVVTEAGSVTVPAAPTAPEGKQFAGWRVLEGADENKTEKLYGVNNQNTINIKENTILNVVWETATPTITLNLNGGTGIENPTFTVTYNNKLPTLATPTRDGVAFDGWVVSEDVTENGEFFAKGSAFDLETPITADLKLTARWKHVHYYTCFQIGEFDDAMAEYQSYADTHHVAVCGCMDVALKAHSFDSNGKCACGYRKPTPTATLGVSYGQWASDSYTAKVTAFPQTATKGTEVSVSAPSTWGSLKFSKWQYSTDDTTWKDLTAYTNVSFVILYDMKVRALYVNPITKPEVNLSATTYPVNVSGYLLDSILFQMNYKLPDGYTYVDSGVRAGDNEGISYYELKERKRTAGQRAAWGAINFGTSLLSGGIGDAVIEGAVSAATLESNYYYEKRENSVLSEMSAATLGSYMYQNKPVNVEKYPPIYWDYKPNTVSYSGSINALIPVRFAQKNNQNHYIYGIAWLRYKKPDGAIETIYTPALATTLNGVGSSGTVTKSGS
ncbi:MAG: carbohydrate-binding domain-containing protein [Oscillospiraceae bacterium]|nr:carbohydrate-binding domain-containing protein [Oscillospiraceae bacterium]